MSITELIHNLRERSPQDRDRIAYGLAGGVTALVALVWFGSVTAQGISALRGGATQTAAVVQSGVGSTTAPVAPASNAPRLEIVNLGQASTIATSSTTNRKTVIPF